MHALAEKFPLGCVDFLPTILSLMGVETAGREEGRDAAELFLTGKAPADWNDIAFFRSTGDESGWLAAATDRYKIVYSTLDDPWLFDLEEDPDELVNCFAQATYRETVREISRQLAQYGASFHDPRAANERLKADLDWAIHGSGPYISPRPARVPNQPKSAQPARRKSKKQKPK